MAANTIQLSRLMRISWDIKKTKRKTRSKALAAAWAICSNEDITISYLMRKLNHNRPVPQKAVGQYGLFA
jgi:hypothetical protein